MGNSESTSNYPPDSFKPQDQRECMRLNNDHTAYIAKQIASCYGAKGKLEELVKTGDIKSAKQNKMMYLVDTNKVLEDTMYMDETGQLIPPLESTMAIFGNNRKLAGISGGQPILKLYTVLDEYNDFFIEDIEKYDDKTNLNRIPDLIQDLEIVINNGLQYISKTCSDIGTVVPQQVQQQ